MIGVNFGTVLEVVMAACLRRVASKAVRLAGWRGRNSRFWILGFWLKARPPLRDGLLPGRAARPPASRRAVWSDLDRLLGHILGRGRKAVAVVDFGARLWPPLHGIGKSGSVFSTTFLNGF